MKSDRWYNSAIGQKPFPNFSPSFSTTPSIFFLSLSLLHNSYLSIFLSISFFLFSFSFQPPLALALMLAFLPLVGLAGLTLAICVLKLREGGKRGLLLHFFFFFFIVVFFFFSFIHYHFSLHLSHLCFLCGLFLIPFFVTHVCLICDQIL